MAKYKLEYIWLDGYEPVPNLRSKTMIKEFDSFPTLEELPKWGFDGSSTKQAEGHSSDCVLKPVAVYPDTTRKNGALVMCEVHAARRHAAPHQCAAPPSWTIPAPGSASSRNISSTRTAARSASRRRAIPLRRGRTTPAWATRTWATSPARSSRSTSTSVSTPASTTKASTPKWPRASGNSRSSAKAPRRPPTRCGSPATSCERLCEKYDVDVEWHCKPIKGDWNGSGMHSNFSTEYMRENGGKEYFEKLMAAFDKYKNEHIAVYGPDNHLRLTGLHETQSIDKFNYGVANRGASIRVPHSFVNNGYKGYLEDRRPNSAGDPYKIASRILQTIATVPTA